MSTKTKREMVARYRKLVGRTIVKVDPGCFQTDNTGEGSRTGWTSDPTFTLDDGTSFGFTVSETEVGEYGIVPVFMKPTDD